MQYQNSKILAVIPARLESKRFPNKLLQTLKGKVILQRVYDNIIKSGITEHVVVATDSYDIFDFCSKRDISTFYMTDDVDCGSERLYYVYKKYPSYDYYISFAADEALIDPQEIKEMWDKYQQSKEYDIYTCGSQFYDYQRITSFRSCKIVVNDRNRILYFSRSPIPLSKEGLLLPEMYIKHVGIFIFKKEILEKCSNSKEIWNGFLSREEGLEQIAFLENNYSVGLIKINHKYYGVDTIEDLQRLEEMI